VGLMNQTPTNKSSLFKNKSIFYGIIPTMGSGLVFCFSQKPHTNALKYHGKDENDIDISYPQYKILPYSSSHL